jgi:hypothetical protein
MTPVWLRFPPPWAVVALVVLALGAVGFIFINWD